MGGYNVAGIKIVGATRRYPGGNIAAVKSLDLEIGDSELVTLVGPSGSGKSTILRMVAGLEPLDEGSIYIGDREVSKLHSKERDIAMIFQNYALYPQMTVAQNIGFSLKIRHLPKSEIVKKVREAAGMLDLVDYLDRKPANLSGGQRQRVAMGRAIVRDPSAFLMDEPLSNLDAKLRVSTRAQIATLQRKLGVTTIYVTHDQVEAMTLGHRIAVLKDGELQQFDTPRQLFTKPVNLFVAGFIGSPSMNMLDGHLDGGDVVFGLARLPLTAHQRWMLTGDRVTIGVRPEGFELIATGGHFDAEVTLVEDLGTDLYVYAVAETDSCAALTIRWSGADAPSLGQTISLGFLAGRTYLFDAATGMALGN